MSGSNIMTNITIFC